MIFYIIQIFKSEIARTFWTISDFITGDTQMRRIIRSVNQQTNRLQKRINRIDMHIAKLMDASNTALYQMEKVYEQPHHTKEMLKYHFKQSDNYQQQIKSLESFKNKCNVVKAQILDQILHAQLADDMNEARMVLKQVNDYNDEMNVAFNMEQYNMETIRGNETRHALDDAVVTAKEDTIIQIDQSEAKMNGTNRAQEEDERFADMVTQIASRLQNKRNQNNGAIEVTNTIANSHGNGPSTVAQLEERLGRLCAESSSSNQNEDN